MSRHKSQKRKPATDEHGVEAYEESGGGISYRPAATQPAKAEQSPYPDAWYNKGKIVHRCEDGDFIAQAVSESAAQTFVNEHNRKAYDIGRRTAAELERVKQAMMTTEAVRLQETRRAVKAEQERNELLAALKRTAALNDIRYANEAIDKYEGRPERVLTEAIMAAERERVKRCWRHTNAIGAKWRSKK
jgi:hypothetical protein